MDCTHRWTIAPPADGVARGVCTHCGQERTVSDTAHTAAWESRAAQERRRRTTRPPSPGEGPPRDTGGHP